MYQCCGCKKNCQYGFFRPYVKQVIYRYLDCGILKNGFARVRCEDCGHEYLLAHSCKRRHFCPSCHQKRVVEFGEWLCQEVVKAVPHRHVVLSIPKILRRYFLYDRKLLSDLSRCGWEALKAFYTAGTRNQKTVQVRLSPSRHLVIFHKDFIPTCIYWFQTAVSTETVCFLFHPLLTIKHWPPARRAYASERADIPTQGA